MNSEARENIRRKIYDSICQILDKDTLSRVVCQDAAGAIGIGWSSIAINTLDLLLQYDDTSKHMNIIRDNGFVSHFLQAIKSQDIDLSNSISGPLQSNITYSSLYHISIYTMIDVLMIYRQYCIDVFI